MEIQIGYAQEIITPSLERPVYLAGFGLSRQASGVHDELYARALAMQADGVKIVLAVLDLIGLLKLHCSEIIARVHSQEPQAQVVIACTHTHHAPDVVGLWGPDRMTSGIDPAYLREVKELASRAIIRALALLRPARLRVASVHVPGVAKNARDPHIVDDELTCLQFTDSRRGSPQVTALIFPCHPEVLWEHNPQITADYAGFLCREVEAATGAPSLFLPGALGGMMTPDVKDHSFAEAEAMGKILAQAALRALSEQEPQNLLAGTFGLWKQEFSVPMTNPLFRLAINQGLLPNILNSQGELATETNLIKVGPLWLATAPGELLPKLGLEVKQLLQAGGAKLAAVVSLVNDELGYILPQEDFIYPTDPLQPGGHYEETMSVGPDIAPRLMAALRALLSVA